MNYRHVFHAGNFADVMKHALLARILVHLGAKPAPYRVIDTHAGTGLYNLASEAARRSPEWRDGIGRIAGAKLPPDVDALLRPYLDIVEPLLAGDEPHYPGSPLIAQKLARTQDRLCFIEKHPVDTVSLKAKTAGDRRVRALTLDGWTGLNAQVPPPEKRGLVLIDPPFEEPGEFDRLYEATLNAYRKWSAGIFALWYPVKNRRTVDNFMGSVETSGIRKVLRLELAVDRVSESAGLAATGLIVINPPWTLKAEAETLLPFLARRLSRGPGHGWTAEWIVAE